MCVNRGGGGGGGGSLEESHQKTWDSFSEKERDAIANYTTDDFELINGYLLGEMDGKPPAGTLKDIQNIDAALAKSVIPTDTILYRGVSKEGYEYMRSAGMLDSGAVFSHKNYMSTTTDRDIANGFTHGAKGTKSDPETVFQVKAPKGSRGLYIGDKVSLNEKELLIPRNAKVRTGATRLESRKVTRKDPLSGKSRTQTIYTRVVEMEIVR